VDEHATAVADKTPSAAAVTAATTGGPSLAAATRCGQGPSVDAHTVSDTADAQ